jgi:hypothetical protein
MKVIKNYKRGKLSGYNIRQLKNGKLLLFNGNKDTGLGEFDKVDDIKRSMP